MKIFAYKVVAEHDDTQPFAERLRDEASKTLVDRLYRRQGRQLRLENHRENSGLVELNFVSFRLGNAPVRVAERRLAEEIRIRNDEYFGEETACLFDPATNYLVVQYNHYGPRVSGIRDVLTYTEDGVTHHYDMAPKLSRDSEERIRRLGMVTRVEVAFAVPDLGKHANELSVAESIELAKAHGAERMEIVLGNRKGLSMGPITDWMLKVQRLFGGDDKAVERFTVRGSDDEDGPRETIDLLADRLCKDWDLPPTGRRVSLDTRINALRAVHEDWLNQKLLT
jgi:hypothetical protein